MLLPLLPQRYVTQVGYIAEYPHTGQSVSQAEGGFNMEQLFWGGKCVELDQGKKVFGQIWPKVSERDTCICVGGRVCAQIVARCSPRGMTLYVLKYCCLAYE